MSGRGHEHRPRTELVAEANRLRAEGLNVREIALTMGKGEGTVRSWFSDPDGSKARALKASYQGACVECGYPTSHGGGSGREKASLRCIYCARGKLRPVSARPRLCVPVRLSEISLDVRLQGAREATRVYRDPDERLEILLAAVQPSERVYWLAESAKPLLEQIAA